MPHLTETQTIAGMAVLEEQFRGRMCWRVQSSHEFISACDEDGYKAGAFYTEYLGDDHTVAVSVAQRLKDRLIGDGVFSVVSIQRGRILQGCYQVDRDEVTGARRRRENVIDFVCCESIDINPTKKRAA